MKVRDDKVGVLQVNVESHSRNKQSGEATDAEKPEEAEDVKHRCFV
jgi:hypothetical protein